MKKLVSIIMILSLVLAIFSGCGKSNDGDTNDVDTNDVGTSDGKTNAQKEDVLLRVGLQFQEDTKMSVFNDAKAKMEEKYPYVTVEYVQQDRNLYQSMGLPTLLNSDNTPDVYFEWSGERLENRKDEGFARAIPDLTGEWEKSYFPSAFSGTIIEDEKYMVPLSTDVSVLMWYNKKIFNDLGITEIPTTWDEFLVVCQTIKDANIVPIAAGNKDLWVAGNWGGHIISRVVGEEAYSNALLLKEDFYNEDFVAAFEYIKELGDKGYVNEDINGIDDEEAAFLFFNGLGAMHPIGNWMVGWALDAAPSDFEFDYFNLPAIEGGKGQQSSVMGVNVGMVINDKTENYSEAVEYLKILTDLEHSKEFANIGDMVPINDAVTTESAHELTVKMMEETLKGTDTVVAPPDTGYSLEVANNLYQAIAKVIGGVATPEEALKELDDSVKHLK